MSRIFKGMMIGTWCAGVIFSFLIIVTTSSYGQGKGYPEKEIKIICGAAGSNSDICARIWADGLVKILKVPVVMANRGGGMTSQVELKRSKPDGYTLCYTSSSTLATQLTTPQPPLYIEKDLFPIGALGGFPTVILVEQSSPFATFDALVDFAKKNPGKLNGGACSMMASHFNLELMKVYSKLDFALVEFRGGSSEAITALLGKHIDFLSLSPAAAIGLLKAGKLRILLTTHKLNDYPNLPLFSEKGLGEAGLLAWTGLHAPLGLQKDVQNKLVDAFAKMAKDPDVLKRIDNLGYTDDYLNPIEWAAIIKKDAEKLSIVTKGLKMIQ